MFRFGPLYENLKEVVDKPFLGKIKPFRVVGNVYFVGVYQASTHIIDTGDGLIMIDPGYSNSAYLVLNSIYELGFKPQDVKYIINTHWHGDHTEATAMFKDLCGAQTLLGEFDVEKAKQHFIPDILIKDGDKLSLGNTTIEFLHTPGHTKGTISFFFDVVENGKVLAELPLEIAGLMTDRPLPEVNVLLENAKDAAYTLGVGKGVDPFMTLSFMALPVIPTVRLTTRGVVDVMTQQYI